MAVGCIGMSVDDFCELTPDEFTAIHSKWEEREDNLLRGSWERMRLLAAVSVSPYSKKSVTPTALIPLPWDKEGRGAMNTVQEQRAESTAERFRQISGRITPSTKDSPPQEE